MTTSKTIIVSGQPVTCIYEKKKVKNINVHVRPDGTVYCSLPYRCSYERAEAFVKSSEKFLAKAIAKTKVRKESESADDGLFENGKKIHIYGEEYILDIRRGEPDFVKDGDRLIITTPDEDLNRGAYEIYRARRRSELEQHVRYLISYLYPTYARLGAPAPQTVKFGEYKSYWGECFPKKRLLKFSCRLYAKDYECIEYVVAHELAHLIEPNHSKAFWKLVEQTVPDYRSIRKRLNSSM